MTYSVYGLAVFKRPYGRMVVYRTMCMLPVNVLNFIVHRECVCVVYWLSAVSKKVANELAMDTYIGQPIFIESASAGAISKKFGNFKPESRICKTFDNPTMRNQLTDRCLHIKRTRQKNTWYTNKAMDTLYELITCFTAASVATSSILR